MPYMVIGAAGMLGTDLMKLFEASGVSVAGLDVQDLDIRNSESVAGALSGFRPGTIINLAALTDVDGCESRVEEAYAVNAAGAGNLARVAAHRGDVLVHMSTDYVFDGCKAGPYVEDDLINPLGVYGASKAAGEQRVREALPGRHCIVRTSWLYGVHGKNFVEAILTAAGQRDVLTVVDDQRGRPTYTFDLAEGLLALCRVGARGTFHVANSGEATWYDFAVRILEAAGVRGVRVEPTTTEKLGRPAPRPGYSVLDCSRFEEATGTQLRSWQAALDAYLHERGKDAV